jgi:hypothetical protein
MFDGEISVAVAHEDKVAAVEDHSCETGKFVPLLFRKVGEILFQLPDGALGSAMFQRVTQHAGSLIFDNQPIEHGVGAPARQFVFGVKVRVYLRFCAERVQHFVDLAAEVALVGGLGQKGI